MFIFVVLGNVRRRRGRAIGLIPQLTDKHTHTQLPAHLKTHTHGNATFTIVLNK